MVALHGSPRLFCALQRCPDDACPALCISSRMVCLRAVRLAALSLPKTAYPPIGRENAPGEAVETPRRHHSRRHLVLRERPRVDVRENIRAPWGERVDTRVASRGVPCQRLRVESWLGARKSVRKAMLSPISGDLRRI